MDGDLALPGHGKFACYLIGLVRVFPSPAIQPAALILHRPPTPHTSSFSRSQTLAPCPPLIYVRACDDPEVSAWIGCVHAQRKS